LNNEIVVLKTILQQMGVAGFRLKDDGFFVPLFDLPEWFSQLYKNKFTVYPENDHYFLGVAFPFIENFLFDAEQVWSKVESDSLYSGLWTEELQDGTELYLEAEAINANGQAVLLFTNETTHFDVRHKVFQAARDLALKNEQLENTVQKHQRQLQQQLEGYCTQSTSFGELTKDIEKESSAVLICRQDGGVEVYNKALIDIYSLTNKFEMQKESLLEKWVKEAERIYPEIHRVLEVGEHWEGEFESTDNLNNKKWIRLMIAPIVDDQRNVVHYICIANDISESRISLSELERITQVDANTKLPNRRSFWTFLSDQIEQKRLVGGQLGLFYVDLDHFKKINDNLGPEQADFLLNTVATRLKRNLKKKDFVAHLGADEFAVITTDYRDNDCLKKIAERIVSGIYREVSFNEMTLNVSASVGIAIYPQHGNSARQVVKSADFAMYHAKEMGRNQYQLFGPNNITESIPKLHIEQGIRKAIKNQEFELVFQPQICIGEKDIYRAEALIRWNHPTLGTLKPNNFIPVAEESGLIIEIGRWVIDEACSALMLFSNNNLKVKIGINVSPKQFKFSNIANDIVEALSKYSVNPSQLELEVTESAFMEDMDDVIKQLQDVRKLGVSISLDDFGTGYSSLSYLKNLPADLLKIDRSFISELPDNKQSKTIVDSLINLAHELSIEVIAEGVENEQQLQYLKDLGCDYFQGYLFHYPLHSERLLELYQNLTKIDAS
jgi:diguanylate cyclase (GGDEF)-like protein